MARYEILEWLVMILVIILWWPLLFMGYDWPVYRVVISVGSLVAVGVIFVRRLKRINEGFNESEQMMRAKREMEKQMNDNKPKNIDDK